MWFDMQSVLISAVREGDLEAIECIYDLNKLSQDTTLHGGYYLLCHALQKGHIYIAEQLLKKGASVNLRKPYGVTPLCIAAKKGMEEIFESIIDRGANLDYVDKYGNSAMSVAIEEKNFHMIQILLKRKAVVPACALHNAVQIECWEIFELLMANGANVSALNHIGETALYTTGLVHQEMREVDFSTYSLSEGICEAPFENVRRKMAELLLANGADMNAQTASGETTLHLAARTGFKDFVVFLLDNGATVDAVNKTNGTPLTLAIHNGHTEICKILLNRGANLKAASSPDSTPFCSLFSGCSPYVEREKIVQLFLEHGADVNGVDEDGHTALLKAALAGTSNCIRLLLEHGANVNASDNDGRTALHSCAIFGSCFDSVPILLKYGAYVEHRDNFNETPLFLAVKRYAKEADDGQNGCEENTVGPAKLVKALLSGGANVNAASNDGQTPFHVAAGGGSFDGIQADLVQILLTFDVDVNRPDASGRTPLHMASERGYADVVELLLEDGADINAICKEGRTALDSVERGIKISYYRQFKCRKAVSFSSLSSDDDDRIESLSDDYLDTYMDVQILIKGQVLRFKAADLPVCESNLRAIQDTDAGPPTERNQRELREIENRKLSNQINLRHILSRNRNVSYVNNSSIVETLEAIDFSAYPQYGCLIKCNFEYDKRKKELLMASKKCMSTLIKTNNVLNSEKLPALPQEIIDEILSYLHCSDLKSLIGCCERLRRQLGNQ